MRSSAFPGRPLFPGDREGDRNPMVGRPRIRRLCQLEVGQRLLQTAVSRGFADQIGVSQGLIHGLFHAEELG
jgi:hypothetical protein